MRQITKQSEPTSLTEWKAQNRNSPNNQYGHIPSGIIADINCALVREQRGICAYTGRRIDAASSHNEHLLPQQHCNKGVEDTDYRNMVACCPAPNTAKLPYGAHEKDSWPNRNQVNLFVSPLSQGCEQRFVFNFQGKIAPAANDQAASETITKLRLDHHELDALRKAAIRKTLKMRKPGSAAGGEPDLIDVSTARNRLRVLNQADQGSEPLEPFCFVLKQALSKHIDRINEIRRKNKARP